MQVSLATAGAPGHANEDYVAAGPCWALILDGATAPEGVDSGCLHSVRWLVHHLAAAVSCRLAAAGERALPDLLADAIIQTCAAHSRTCDLANPDSPSTTVSLVRTGDDSVEYLTLGDSPVVLARGDGTYALVADDRVAHLPGGPPYSTELVRTHRNTAGGFWVASTKPEAAYQAVTGETDRADVTEAALFTDGVTRLADWYGYSWPAIFSVLRGEGPQALIARVRAAERTRSRPFEKQHDDASAIYIHLMSDVGGSG